MNYFKFIISKNFHNEYNNINISYEKKSGINKSNNLNYTEDNKEDEK